MRRMVEVDRWGVFTRILSLAAGVALIAGGMVAHAQATAGSSGQQARSYETLHLNGSLTRDEVRDIYTNLLNMVPHARISVASSQYVISVAGTPDELALARRVFDSLNHARPSYRLTYTITETDNGKTDSVRKVALCIVSGGKAEAKQGLRAPVATETANSSNGREANTQFQYVNTGVAINASLDGPGAAPGDTLWLQTRMSVMDMESISGTQQPVIWTSTINGPVTLTVGKTATLESINVPGTVPGKVRHLTITVIAEPAA